jgi:hypothetical protein
MHTPAHVPVHTPRRARRLERVAAHVVPAAAAAAGARAHQALQGAAAVQRQSGAGKLVDLPHFEEHGWVIVRQAVPRANVEAVRADIETFLGVDLADQSSWYTGGGSYGETKYEIGAGMVEMYQSQAIWDNRQHPKVHAAFAEVFGTEALTVSIDRVSLKPPEVAGDTSGWGRGLGLHWDGARPKHAVSGESKTLRVQGVLCLSDTLGENSGGFVCVDGFSKRFDGWAASLPAELLGKPFMEQPSLAHLAEKPLAVQARAGDLNIWNRRRPPGNGAA